MCENWDGVMENIKKRIATFLKSDSPKEIADNLPKGVISFLLASPAMFFIITMAVVLIKYLLLKNNTYRADMNWVNFDGMLIGLFAVAAYFLKLHYCNKNRASVFKNPTVICFGALIVFMLLLQRCFLRYIDRRFLSA